MKTTKIEDIEIIELPTEWPIGPVNLFLIKGEKLTLVDAGRRLERAWEQFNAALNERGYSIMDIEQVVLTHHHTDHIGLINWLLERNPIPVYAHPNCRPYLEQDEKYFKWARTFFTTFFQEQGVPEKFIKRLASSNEDDELKTKVDFINIEEGSFIPGLSEWRVFETKGHAQSHISLYRPRDQVFVSGDLLIKHMPSGIFLEAPIAPESIRSKPLIQYIESLEKCLTFPVSLALSGHGEAMEDVQQHIHETLRKIDKRAQRVKNFLRDGKKTSFQLTQGLYPDKYENALWLLLTDTVSLLDLLVARNEIQLEVENGVVYYLWE
ncbi:MBL fold metallo-hydrolase [Robertmurraya yapensis]|uniref:MBL fold metallo-hydrolase n=1 Tax=Bacillus yapensis TaxID=2492960 RepID=A0A3S0RQH7_9BACI|nr:MBL fold metallo-hydrolase [Bacillus yapensis]RTR33949.1 MBL fold metallo-hydrolase [Bacillus yapensis]TKS97267.1 MBL fold metallo-hydrolase [Bacillus yapensis]